MASAGHVPSGLRGIRSDFAHFCRVHGATVFRARLRLLLASRAFWGLAIYRFGRWVYGRPRHPLMRALRALYVLLFEAGRLLTKTSLSVRSRIESEVWIAPRGEVFISLAASVGRGSMLHGGNTLGVGGRPGARGHPRLGERVILAPGASAVGPAQIPDGAVIGANTLIGRSLPCAGGWAGIPPKLVPAERIPIPTKSRCKRSISGPRTAPIWSATSSIILVPARSPGCGLRSRSTDRGRWPCTASAAA